MLWATWPNFLPKNFWKPCLYFLLDLSCKQTGETKNFWIFGNLNFSTRLDLALVKSPFSKHMLTCSRVKPGFSELHLVCVLLWYLTGMTSLMSWDLLEKMLLFSSLDSALHQILVLLGSSLLLKSYQIPYTDLFCGSRFFRLMCCANDPLEY